MVYDCVLGIGFRVRHFAIWLQCTNIINDTHSTEVSSVDSIKFKQFGYSYNGTSDSRLILCLHIYTYRCAAAQYILYFILSFMWGGKHHNICCNFSYEMFVAQWQSMVTKSGRKGIATIAMQKCIGHSSYSLERDIGSAIRLVSACASVFNSLSFTRQS